MLSSCQWTPDAGMQHGSNSSRGGAKCHLMALAGRLGEICCPSGQRPKRSLTESALEKEDVDFLSVLKGGDKLLSRGSLQGQAMAVLAGRHTYLVGTGNAWGRG